MGIPPMTQLVCLRGVRLRDRMETELHLWVWDLEDCGSSRRDFPARRRAGAVSTLPVAVQLPASTYPLLIMWI